MQIGVLNLNFSERTAHRGSKPVPLTAIEWELLELLLQNVGRPLPAQYMLSEVWGSAFREDDAYLATWIWRLRQKIEPDPRWPVFLKTVVPLGYLLDVEPSGAQAGPRGTARPHAEDAPE